MLTFDSSCSCGVSMPNNGMLFSVIFISSAISAFTPEMLDIEAMSAAATGERTTEGPLVVFPTTTVAVVVAAAAEAVAVVALALGRPEVASLLFARA